MATRRSRLVFAGAGALVIAALAAGVLWLGSRGDTAGGSGRIQAPPGQADQVAAALRKLSSDPQSLVASETRSQVNGHARQAVPPGSTVVPDARSWAPDGLGGGTMLVTITAPGHAPVSYYAVMVKEANQWKVLAT